MKCKFWKHKRTLYLFLNVHIYNTMNCERGGDKAKERKPNRNENRPIVAIPLKLPFAVIKRAHLACLKPSVREEKRLRCKHPRADTKQAVTPGDAVEMKGVVAHSPSHSAFFGRGAGLVGLALDAQIHDVVAADGAVVHLAGG